MLALRDVLLPLSNAEKAVDRVSNAESKPVRATSPIPEERMVYASTIRLILGALEFKPSDPVFKVWLGLADKAKGLAGRAHRRNLDEAPPKDSAFCALWDETETVLDEVLDRLEARAERILRVLDSLLAKNRPTKTDAETLKKSLPNSFFFRSYFFSRAGSCWLSPLRAADIFSDVPAPLEDVSGVRCRPWPEAAYLARMAAGPADQQKEVLDVIRPIASTRNFWVQEDFLDAALALPPDLSVAIASAIPAWLEGPFSWGLPEKAGKLIAHLATGGQESAAIDLARFVLCPTQKPEAEGVARFDFYHYERILKDDIPLLTSAGGLATLRMLCDLLENSVRSLGDGPRSRPSDDSWLWRAAIEDHSQNMLASLEDLLVSAIRDTTLQITEKDPAQLISTVDELERRGLPIFLRLALHLLRMSTTAPHSLIEERLTDRSKFENILLMPEFAFLSRDRFSALSLESQTLILSWIREGPDMARFAKSAGQHAVEGDEERYRKLWQRKRLTPIRDSLPPDWRRQYAQIIAEVGESSYPEEFTHWVTSVAGPTSPKSKDQLASMSVEDLLEYLRRWEPREEWMGPSREGVGRHLTELVAEEPERFDSVAPIFQDSDPAYVCAMIQGFLAAARKGKSLHWISVLELCRWAVKQPRPKAVGNRDPEPGQPDWRSVRQDVACLLSVGLDSSLKEAQIPFELRAVVWEVLNPITDDPDPPSDREALEASDVFGLSINSARGWAMRAVFCYAQWVGRNLATAQSKGDRVSGFDSMPEVRTVLDAHLDTVRDPSLAIRTVYGEYFCQAVLLDQNWTEANVGRVFSTRAEDRPFRDAAWGAYLSFGHFCDQAFDQLQAQYIQMIEELSPSDEKQESAFSRGGRLAAHLMFSYCTGRVGFKETCSMLSRFFEKASGPLRAEAVRCLRGGLREKDVDVRERLEDFWEWRLMAARGASSADGFVQELAAFGWWFASGKLPDLWAVARLSETLKLSGKIDPQHSVMERLAEVSQRMPEEALECLALIVGQTDNGPGLLSGRQQAKTVLSTAIQSGSSDGRKRAIELTNRLIARGYLDFRDVLPTEPI